jgi:hypothetical protein
MGGPDGEATVNAWKVLAVVAGVLAILALLAGAFALGVRVGGAQAYRAGFHDMFPPPPPPTGAWLAGHSVVGTVEQVDLRAELITVRGERGVYALVQVGDDTLLERRGQRIGLAAVQAGERIVAIGAPDDEGHIAARVIRMLDARASRPASLWGELARGAYRVYHALQQAWRGLLGRKTP